MLIYASFSSCIREKTVFNYEINNAEFVSDDMVFEGSNTLQLKYMPQLAQAAGISTLTEDQIISVKLTKATLSTEDSMHFDNINSITLQLSTDKTDMQEIAVISPVSENSDQLNMTVSAETDVAEAFKQKEIYLIADIDVKQDQTMPIHFKAALVFEITIKK